MHTSCELWLGPRVTVAASTLKTPSATASRLRYFVRLVVLRSYAVNTTKEVTLPSIRVLGRGGRVGHGRRRIFGMLAGHGERTCFLLFLLMTHVSLSPAKTSSLITHRVFALLQIPKAPKVRTAGSVALCGQPHVQVLRSQVAQCAAVDFTWPGGYDCAERVSSSRVEQ